LESTNPPHSAARVKGNWSFMNPKGSAGTKLSDRRLKAEREREKKDDRDKRSLGKRRSINHAIKPDFLGLLPLVRGVK